MKLRPTKRTFVTELVQRKMVNPLAATPHCEVNTTSMFLFLLNIYFYLLIITEPVPLQGCTIEKIYEAGTYGFSGYHGLEASVECLAMDPDNELFFPLVCFLLYHCY